MNTATVVFVGVALLGFLFLLYNIFFFLVTHVPYVRTPRTRITQILDVLAEHEERPLRQLTFVDVGSGLGHMLRAAEKAGFQRVIGYELSPLHVLLTRLWLYIVSSKAEVIRKDAFGSHLREADVIYYFLTKLPMERLTVAVQDHTKPGTLIVGLGTALTNVEPIAAHKVKKTGSTIYVYRTPLSKG